MRPWNVEPRAGRTTTADCWRSFAAASRARSASRITVTSRGAGRRRSMASAAGTRAPAKERGFRRKQARRSPALASRRDRRCRAAPPPRLAVVHARAAATPWARTTAATSLWTASTSRRHCEIWFDHGAWWVGRSGSPTASGSKSEGSGRRAHQPRRQRKVSKASSSRSVRVGRHPAANAEGEPRPECPRFGAAPPRIHLPWHPNPRSAGHAHRAGAPPPWNVDRCRAHGIRAARRPISRIAPCRFRVGRSATRSW